MLCTMNLKKTDKQIYDIIQKEAKRQAETLMMIPSENMAPEEIREAVGSILINKYSEGQPYRRYYQGMENVNILESLVEKRALKAFHADPDAWDVNVQAYSGSPANAAVYLALLEPGDTIMSMFLPDGGHISHGWIFKERKLSLASKIYNISFYHVDPKTKIFDYEEIAKQAKKVKPKLIISGGTAYPRDIRHDKLGKIAKSIGAYYLADISHEAGLVATEVLQSPFKYADAVMCTTHKTLRGPRGALIFIRKEHIDALDKAVFPGLQGGPHNHTIAGIGVALKHATTSKFKAYAKQVVKNAQVLAAELKKAGYDVVSGGTDKHLILLDLRKQGLSGNIPAMALEKAGIICNYNTVPYDTGSPMYPSGLRLGTPGITTRNMKEKQMKQIAHWIDEVIKETSQYVLPEKGKKEFVEIVTKNLSKNKKLIDISTQIKKLCRKFPIPD